LYVALDHYPSMSWYTAASGNVGNAESINIAAPVAGRWYYVMLKARQPFSGVTLSATYE
jgi:microbial collagenase